jgi:hypothetical protein
VPRYLVETCAVSAAERAVAERLAAQRFPEVALEHRYTVGEGAERHDLWVCRASSKAHVQRWSETSGLALGEVRRIEDDSVI